MAKSNSEKFGGPRTVKKLKILAGYLNAYTTALKDQPSKDRPFTLVYIDAFAGDGRVRLLLDEEGPGFITGSPQIALNVEDKPFDKLYFNELNSEMFKRLKNLKRAYPDRDIHIFNRDANEFTQSVLKRIDWVSHRGVIFLDPFATEVRWETMEQIAHCNALDTWVLFPVGAVARLMPRSKEPGDVDAHWTDRLNTIFGDDDWNRAYQEQEKIQGTLAIDDFTARERGVKLITKIYKDKLASLFRERLLGQSRTLLGQNNAPLFEFIFCSGSDSEKSVTLSHKIAKHIINQI